MKHWKKWIRNIAIGLLLVVVVAAVGFKIYVSGYYRADKKTIQAVEKKYETQVSSYEDEEGMVFLPKDQEYRAVIVFYPGGKVEHGAYSGFMYELASRGYICLLPRMPENLAFLRVHAVDLIRERHPEETQSVSDLNWYLAGHSLGGVAAAAELGEHMEEYQGLILCGSYTTVDFSGTNLQLLSIYGSNDGVLKMNKYEENRAHWPSDATEVVLPGGNHSYFGCYGVQKGDGKATITNEEQIQMAADAIEQWMDERATTQRVALFYRYLQIEDENRLIINT